MICDFTSNHFDLILDISSLDYIIYPSNLLLEISDRVSKKRLSHTLPMADEQLVHWVQRYFGKMTLDEGSRPFGGVRAGADPRSYECSHELLLAFGGCG